MLMIDLHIKGGSDLRTRIELFGQSVQDWQICSIMLKYATFEGSFIMFPWAFTPKSEKNKKFCFKI